MRILTTELEGAYVIEPEPIVDDRGSFARTFSAADFASVGIDARVDQCSASFNRVAGTLRGMHFQQAPFGETKLVRCTRGRIFDALVDVRSSSPTRGKWIACELGEDDGRALLVPPGVAHGFLTLVDESEVLYQISVPFAPDASLGIRWDDPVVGIEWPHAPRVLSERDASLPAYGEVFYLEDRAADEEADAS